MENAQLVSLSRQIALQRQMDVVANNMANLNTTGFKAEDMLFEQYKMPVAADNDFARQPVRVELHAGLGHHPRHDDRPDRADRQSAGCRACRVRAS